jgi:citrate lyase subunit beta/citryl-CoA lyase
VSSRHRSCLVCPGSSPRMLAKLGGLPADEVIVDLEDAVAPAAKDEARELVTRWLASAELGGRHLSIRVNPVGSPWGEADLLAVAGAERRPDSVVLPKVEQVADLDAVAGILAGAGAGRSPLPLQALIETAAGLGRVDEIAGGGNHLAALIIGYADLAASLGRSTAAEPAIWDPSREALLVAARSNGLRAIDGPYLGTDAGERLRADARRAQMAGFDGKWAIHPSQIEPLNEIFTPAAAELEWAHRVIAALHGAEERGAGAIELDGQMIDEALRASARRILARAPGESD